MDSHASAKDANFQVCGMILQFQQPSTPGLFGQKNAVGYMKYAKLPDYDFESRVRWPQRNSYVLQPRLRRIVTINDEDNLMRVSNCLRDELGLASNTGTTSKRKICSISEEADNFADHSKEKQLAKNRLIPSKNVKLPTKSIEYSSKSNSLRAVSPSVGPHRYLKRREFDLKSSAKSDALNTNKNLSVPNTHKPRCLSAQEEAKIRKENISENKKQSQVKSTNKQTVEGASLSIRNVNSGSNTNYPAIIKKEQGYVQPDQWTRPTLAKDSHKNNESLLSYHYNPSKHKTNQRLVIRVPSSKKSNKVTKTLVPAVVEASTCIERNTSDINIGTDPESKKVDAYTEIDLQQDDSTIQTIEKSIFENLEIPNYTLLKDKTLESKDELISIPRISSLPNLQMPAITFSSLHDDKNASIDIDVKSSPYIIRRTTLTYTTKQKIDFHVVSNNELSTSSHQSSPLAYPMNVMSVFREKINKKDLNEPMSHKDAHKKKNRQNCEYANHMMDIHPLNCSFISNTSKLVKPSELINTISVNDGFLQNHDICEQFRRELNFIDSFFESLQYLENCSLSLNTFKDKNVENWVSKSGFDISNPEYDALLSNFENGTNIDDTETMASKSLCLLNLLIRDEQRRAKNLLFVLKMREDALKDFTKSQILWLENKKKNDNIDVPSLKKKQRGALLKLQHECGEMQRMRKALLALSEKRKLALLKTKKNIELKLNSNVNADHLLLNKKKLKRNSNSDRPTVPLKCFDLSSSGCEESGTSRLKSESALEASPPQFKISSSAEKSIQTGDSLLNPNLKVDVATCTASENNVTVDGGYLNILFSNLTLPDIFSAGKQYEVNEKALISILNSANNHCATIQSDISDKLIDLIKSNTRDHDSSSTPSTARSLVEEFDQYYKDLKGDDKFSHVAWRLAVDTDNRKSVYSATDPAIGDAETAMYVTKGKEVEAEPEEVQPLSSIETATETKTVSETEAVTEKDSVAEVDVSEAETELSGGLLTEADSLLSSAGAATAAETPCFPPVPKVEIPAPTESSFTIPIPPPMMSPVNNEAEELRRQQLAIEREIKALEQQQSQLLVVREIPDKPPPPYTPPADSRSTVPPRMFLADDTLEKKVETTLFGDIIVESTNVDAFDVFFRDFCKESVNKYKDEVSDMPWDACNLLPQKPPLSKEKLTAITVADMKEVLTTGGTSIVSSSVGTRRADHIDEILFSEWRRCEPEWTALHSDEVKVKSQIFESIFQRILSKTINEYKSTVLSNDNVNSDRVDSC